MTAAEGERHLTALDLDRLSLGDLTPADRERLGAHCARCARCAARRSEHGSFQERFRIAVLPRTLTAIAARRLALPSRVWALATVLPVGAALLLVAAHSFDRENPRGDKTPAAATLGIKGDGVMEVFARRAANAPTNDGATVVRVADGTHLAPGDALRFVLYPTGLPYALIASVDGGGQASVYFPFHGEASAAIDAATALAVPGSIVLDRAAGPERLFAIFSEQAIEARVVRPILARIAAGGSEAIRAAGRLPLPGTVQATLLFEKEPEQERGQPGNGGPEHAPQQGPKDDR